MKNHKSIPKHTRLHEKLMGGIFLILLILLLSCTSQELISQPASGFNITYTVCTYTEDEKMFEPKDEFQAEITIRQKNAGNDHPDTLLVTGLPGCGANTIYAISDGDEKYDIRMDDLFLSGQVNLEGYLEFAPHSLNFEYVITEDYSMMKKMENYYSYVKGTGEQTNLAEKNK
ncbi:MAG: hypothetical protein H7X71_06110 [Chitinophagales bacterium]|nr:hypothetical protein [Chitinophagales bacterium]